MLFLQLRRVMFSIAAILMATGCLMSDAIAQSLLSPEVHSDGRVTPQLETAALLQQYPSLAGTEPAANSLKHLWIPIGDEDFLLERNDKFVEQLRTAGVKHDYLKTEGGHEWKLWRDYLPQFLEKVVGK